MPPSFNYRTTGEGHLYQGRYKSFPVQGDEHFLFVCRYVERNAFSAELCKSPDDWKYGSLFRWRHGTAKEKSLLTKWPIRRHPNWVDWVRKPITDKEQKRLQRSILRGAPFGEDEWVRATAQEMDLESTLRPRGRPRKQLNADLDSADNGT